MLTLTLNGNTIPLSANFSMQLTWKSPMTDFDKIPAGYGLDLSFPINEYTRSIFGNPERFAKYRQGNDQKFSGFEVRFSGVLLMAGTLSIIGVSATDYEANLIDPVGVLGEREQERNILDIPRFKEPMNWENSSDYKSDTHTYCCFPIKNGGFFTDKGLIVKRTVYENIPGKGLKATKETYDIEVLSYLFNKTSQMFINRMNTESPPMVSMFSGQIELTNVIEKYNTYETGKVSVISPFFFLNYVIKEALADNEFHITENCLLDDEQLKNLCIYNSYDITKTVYYQSSELIYEPFTIHDELNGVDITNHSSEGYKLYSYYRWYDMKTTPKNHLPKIKVGDLLLSTQNLVNVCFHFLPNNTLRILSREKIITAGAIDLDPYFLGIWSIGEQKQTALKFTREHEQNDMVFSERFNDLSDRKSDIRQPVASWAELWAIFQPQEGEIRLMTSTNTFYEYKWITQEKVDCITRSSDTTDALGWEEISIGLQNGWYEFGRQQVEEIKTCWSSILGNQQINLVNQPGNMDTWKARQQSFSPRLMIYNGNNSGGVQNSEFSFEYENPQTGLLPKYWKNWNRFWANRLPVSAQFDLPVNVLRQVIYNICQKYRTREGEFLIDQMSCEIFIDRIGTTSIKGFKV